MAELAHLSVPGTLISVRATPRARRNAVTIDQTGAIRVSVTAPPDNGKANAAAAELLAKSLGVAKSRLTLVRGATARDKVFRLD